MKLIGWLAFALAIIGGIVGTAGLILATSARSQITQDQHVIRAQQAALSAAQAAVNDAQAKINGEHRDLITCADLNSLINGYTTQNAGNYIGLNQYLTANGAGYTLPMPPHCYNQ